MFLVTNCPWTKRLVKIVVGWLEGVIGGGGKLRYATYILSSRLYTY